MAPPKKYPDDLKARALTTLAVAAGPRVIAVVLSGRGNDDATGTTAVRRFGGTVIAATTASSSQPSMPQATIDRHDAIDHIVAVDDIAALLIDLVTAPLAELPATPE